jgi:hypothetical protein
VPPEVTSNTGYCRAEAWQSGGVARAVIVVPGKKPYQEIVRTAGSRGSIAEGIDAPKGYGALVLYAAICRLSGTGPSR